MKKLLAILLTAALLLSCSAAFAETTDATTSASVADYYGDFALAGDDLMNAINSVSGFYLVCTENPDGSANATFFIYGCVKNGDKYYLTMGLAENQSKQNLLANGEGMAVYAANPTGAEGAKPYAVSGARIYFTLVTDEALLTVLNPENKTYLFCEITAVRPLG